MMRHEGEQFLNKVNPLSRDFQLPGTHPYLAGDVDLVAKLASGSS